MKFTPQQKLIIATAEALGYTGEHALNTSGNPDEDEIEMVEAEMATGSTMYEAIEEVVRTRKHREQA